MQRNKPTIASLITSTCAEAREALARAGVQGKAAEAMLEATGKDRHAARARRFAAMALDEYLRVTNRSNGIPKACAVEAHTYAIAVLVLDAFGLVTAHGPTEALQKVHHRAFRDGCGPRIGPMAGATHAAARAAVDELWRAAVMARGGRLPKLQSPSQIVLWPWTSPAGVLVEMPGLPLLGLAVEMPDTMTAAQSPAWLRTIAIEGSRRALGLPPWFRLGAERVPCVGEKTPSPSIFDLVAFEGSADEWAVVLNAALERERLDRICRDLVTLGRELAKKEPLFWLPPWQPQRRERPSREYLLGWLGQAIADRDQLERVIALLRDGTAVEVIDAVFEVLTSELTWIRNGLRFGEVLVGKDLPQRLRCAAGCLLMLGAAAAPNDLVADHIAIEQFAQARRPPLDLESALRLVERAVKGLSSKFGAVVLSPEHGLEIVFEQDGAHVRVDDMRHSQWPDVRALFLPLVERIADAGEKGMLDAAVGRVKVIGTGREWRELAADLRRASGAEPSS